MPKTLGGRGAYRFAHMMKYPSRHHPLVERGSTQEITYPYRKAESWVVRLPLTRIAVAFGTWGDPVDEEYALARAIGYEEIDFALVQEKVRSAHHESGEESSGAADRGTQDVG